ncbi:hypothetical protein BKA62DRAFT_828444 [Auriculariales sp. MPI-PUGE-AT-0066]|nr:hypothetical protein BKA62DRAFT_828444 [Auriculariales sp. MPI-PUGE-AT-0066]
MADDKFLSALFKLVWSLGLFAYAALSCTAALLAAGFMLATALLNADIVASSNVLKRAAPTDIHHNRSSSEFRSPSEALDSRTSWTADTTIAPADGSTLVNEYYVTNRNPNRMRHRALPVHPTLASSTSIAEAATLQPQQYASVTSTSMTSFAPAIRPLPVPPRLETIVTAPLPPPKAIPLRTRRGKDDEWTQPRHDESFWLPVRQPEVLRTDSAASLLAQISSDDQEGLHRLYQTSPQDPRGRTEYHINGVAPVKLHDDIVAALALVRHCDAVHLTHAVEDSDFTDEEIHLLTPFSDQSPALSRRGKI